MSNVREDAVDLNGANAGAPEPEPEMDSVDAIGEKAGITVDSDRPLAVKEMLDARDSARPTQHEVEDAS